MSDFLLKGLNDLQKKVVLHKDGPLLVLAGAGTGKTRAISHRVAYLISQGVSPKSILAITFTNKAAGEMKERIKNILQSHETLAYVSQPFVSTFHSLGVHILRKSGQPVGVSKNFSILDKGDSTSIIKKALKDLDIDPKQFQPQKAKSAISKLKGELVTVDGYLLSAGEDFFPSTIALIWEKYEAQLKEQNALDFDDLISKTVLLFQNDKKTVEYYQDLWKYVLIDEYQDTNKSQYKLSKILTEKSGNICAIGDVDQSIYGFRGADLKNILNFEKDYPDHVMVTLEENYRSTQTILEAAGNVIEKNKFRRPKKLSAKKGKGAGISLLESRDEEEEAGFVTTKIKELIEAGENPSEIAILYRANFQSRILEEFCIKKNLPYQLLGTRFYERKEIKDIFAFIKAALNQGDRTSIERIINVPPRGIGKITVGKYFEKTELKLAAQKKISEFMELLEEIREVVEDKVASEAISFIMRKSGYQEHLVAAKEGGEERLENLKELVTIATRYNQFGAQGVEKLLEDAALTSDQDNIDSKKEAVRLMTVHSAKGLEFKNVFIVGMEEGLFPHSMSRMETPEKQEEERRLFYVAITRAKDKLFLSFSVSRMIFGSRQVNMPSSFLADIPEHLLDHEELEEEGKVIEYL